MGINAPPYLTGLIFSPIQGRVEKLQSDAVQGDILTWTQQDVHCYCPGRKSTKSMRANLTVSPDVYKWNVPLEVTVVAKSHPQAWAQVEENDRPGGLWERAAEGSEEAAWSPRPPQGEGCGALSCLSEAQTPSSAAPLLDGIYDVSVLFLPNFLNSVRGPATLLSHMLTFKPVPSGLLSPVHHLHRQKSTRNLLAKGLPEDLLLAFSSIIETVFSLNIFSSLGLRHFQ